MRFRVTVAVMAAVLSSAMGAAPTLAHDGENHAAAPQTADGRGVVKAIDLKAGTVTLQHEPIAALKWPAMTMKFRVESAQVLNGVTVGKTVHFILKNDHGKPVVTAIHIL